MTLGAAIDSYRNDLHERHYSVADMQRKQNLLRRWLSYAVALHQPGLPSRLLKMTAIRLYGRRGVVGAAGTAERHAAVAEFLHWWRTADANVRHVALATLVDQYRREQLAGCADEARRRRAVDDFCRGLGLELALRSMAANTYRQALGWLRAQSIERAATYSATFFVYCGEQGWLSFQPPSRTVREPYQRVFDADFLGTDGGLWNDRLRRYLEYLKSERNLSDGGIDYYVRKLKVFVEWLNASAEAEPITVPAIKRFLSERHRQGCKLRTVAKHLYTLRVFFEFLIDKGIIDSNPALELSLRADPAEPRETLTQLEVAQLIEFLEDQQRASRERLEVAAQSTHFRAVRDRCLVLLLVLTGVRAGEACGMRLADIDFAKRSIRIQAKGNRSHRHKQREILLPDALWSALGDYLEVRAAPGQDRLWITWNKNPVTVSGLNKIITRRVREAGIEKVISPHRLRATCASLYVKKGVDPFFLKTLLGHRSISTTMDHYTRLNEEDLRAVWKRTNPLAGLDDE